jgi:hypothetical protein
MREQAVTLLAYRFAFFKTYLAAVVENLVLN